MKSDLLGSAGATEQPRLRGRMNVLEVALTVLAFAAPLTTAWGYLPFVIIFAGTGAPWAFIIAMCLLLVFSVGYVKMSSSIPNPGAFYAFISAGINRSFGLASSFLATMAYLLIVSGVSTFFGIVSSGLIAELSSGGLEIPWYVMTFVLMILVGIFGYVGIEVSAKALAIVMVVEVLLVLAFNAAVLIKGGPDGRTMQPWALSSLGDGNIALGVMFAIVMFAGFEATAVFREEARDPDKTIPRATYIAVAFIGLFNATTVWLLIMATGVGEALGLAESDPASMFPTAYGVYLGPVMKDLATVLVLTSMFASALATHNIFARYTYSLGVDGALPRRLGSVHPKQGSPHVASVTASIVAALVVAVVAIAGFDPGLFYGPAAGVGSFCVLILMLLTMFAVVLFFRRRGAQEGDSLWSTLIAPVIAGAGVTAIIVLVLANANDFIGSPTALSITFILGIVLLFGSGLIVAQRIKRTRPEVYARLGRQ
jgi:amino acid transporter